MRGMGRVATVALCAAAGLAAGAADVAAQDYRGHSATTVRYMEFRPLGRDTVSRSEVTEGPGGELTYRGIPVTCDQTGVCEFFTSQPEEHTVLVTEDLRFTTWGYGVEGLSATFHLRGRGEIGGQFTWPHSDDHFDLLAGYLKLTREHFDLKVGRQRTRSGLGFSSFDGARVTVRPEDWLRAEAFGGRSLARGLHDPRHEALDGVTDFLPDRQAWILGASASAEPVPGASVSARYQRELWSDDAGLISERVSVDTRLGVLRPLRITGSLDWDVAFGRIGKSYVDVQLPLPERDLVLEVEGRHHVPYFEMWTIWGFFSPVGYDQLRTRVTWAPSPDVAVWGAGAWRRYGDANVSGIGAPLSDDAWRYSAGGRWNLGTVALDGTYRVEKTPGAFLSSGQVAATWREGRWLELSIQGTAAQQIEQYRIGEGMLAGGGASANVRVVDGVRLSGGVRLYRRFFDNRPAERDWNQLRGWTTLRIGLGGDPGLEGGELR